MARTAAAEFDSVVQTANVWLKDVMEEMGWQDRHRAYHALRVVLHALRDRLTVDEVATLGAQLPMLVRGFYYEGWHPAGKPVKERKKEAFLAHIAEAFRGVPEAEPEAVARGVIAVLARHITAGELEGVKHCLPDELKSLFP